MLVKTWAGVKREGPPEGRTSASPSSGAGPYGHAPCYGTDEGAWSEGKSAMGGMLGQAGMDDMAGKSAMGGMFGVIVVISVIVVHMSAMGGMFGKAGMDHMAGTSAMGGMFGKAVMGGMAGTSAMGGMADKSAQGGMAGKGDKCWQEPDIPLSLDEEELHHLEQVAATPAGRDQGSKQTS